MTMRHTPTPWRVSRDESNAIEALDHTGLVVWQIALCAGHAGMDMDASGAGNAAFIVRACNAHYEAVAAMRIAQIACSEGAKPDERERARNLIRTALNRLEIM